MVEEDVPEAEGGQEEEEYREEEGMRLFKVYLKILSTHLASQKHINMYTSDLFLIYYIFFLNPP